MFETIKARLVARYGMCGVEIGKQVAVDVLKAKAEEVRKDNFEGMARYLEDIIKEIESKKIKTKVVVIKEK